MGIDGQLLVGAVGAAASFNRMCAMACASHVHAWSMLLLVHEHMCCRMDSWQCSCCAEPQHVCLQAGYKDDLTKEEAMELVARAIRCGLALHWSS